MALKQVHVAVRSGGLIEISVISEGIGTATTSEGFKSFSERSKRVEQHTKKSAAARLKQLAQEIENGR